MNRVRNLLGMTGAATVVFALLAAGCSQSDVLSASTDAQAPDGTSVSTADLPEVVVTASRTRPKPIVLTQRESDSITK